MQQLTFNFDQDNVEFLTGQTSMMSSEKEIIGDLELSFRITCYFDRKFFGFSNSFVNKRTHYSAKNLYGSGTIDETEYKKVLKDECLFLMSNQVFTVFAENEDEIEYKCKCHINYPDPIHMLVKIAQYHLPDIDFSDVIKEMELRKDNPGLSDMGLFEHIVNFKDFKY